MTGLLFIAPLFLAIDIGVNPTLADVGPFTLSWHGLFTAVGIGAGVSLSVWLARRDGIPSDIGLEIAMVSIPAAILGARLFYVAEHWNKFQNDIPGILFGITEGGITLYGGLIGGALAGAVYSAWRKWPLAIGLDAAAPGMVLGQGIGRIGDLLNGEHLGTPTDVPWAVRYTHPETAGELGIAVHPTAGGYELIGDLIIVVLLVFVGFRYIRTPGWIFVSYMLMYPALRFALSGFRLDEQEVGSVAIPQLVSAILIGVALTLAVWFRRNRGPITREWKQRIGRGEGELSP